ncbi:hypothetical protein HK15_11630 [Acetobacter orientalis]|uniref:Uncharacterized protein n=1 Tax=Acetobacter orientalis TaxID=146474 RepID=A0A252B4I2_9PROT|nr:hypothetical protein HK15_11630 [Acetobacter orientalis]
MALRLQSLLVVLEPWQVSGTQFLHDAKTSFQKILLFLGSALGRLREKLCRFASKKWRNCRACQSKAGLN